MAGAGVGRDEKWEDGEDEKRKNPREKNHAKNEIHIGAAPENFIVVLHATRIYNTGLSFRVSSFLYFIRFILPFFSTVIYRFFLIHGVLSKRKKVNVILVEMKLAKQSTLRDRAR